MRVTPTRLAAGALAALSVWLPACSRHAATSGAPGSSAPSGSPSEPVASRADPTVSKGMLPDPALTPGATLNVTKADICVPGYSSKVRNVPSSVKQQVYAEYGIASHRPGEYEVDHLISLELGGSNSIKNLWPQSYETQPWNARVKDRLENDLHDEVCAGRMDLKTAQQEIATDWIAAYKKHYHTDRPLSTERKSRRGRRG